MEIRGKDYIHGDDEDIIAEMNAVNAELNDRIDEIRGTSNTAGVDPLLAKTLHERMAQGTTHLTSGLHTANENIEAARGRMAISEQSAGRTNAINTSIGAGPIASRGVAQATGNLASGIAAHQQARPTGVRRTPQAGPVRGPAPSMARAPEQAQRPAQYVPQYTPQYTAQTHTTSGGIAPTFSEPVRPTMDTQYRVPPTAYAPQTTYLPTSAQQAANWYADAQNARMEALRASQQQRALSQQQAQQLADTQHRASQTEQARRDRASSYLQASNEQAERMREARAAQTAEQYAERQAEARERQQQQADFLREQTQRENERYADMLKEMESRTVDDLPERTEPETRRSTLESLADLVATEFDEPEDAGRVVPKDVYNDMLQEFMAETEVPEHESTQAATDLGMNREELKEHIYQILKEEDERQAATQQAFASQPNVDAGSPSSTVLPVAGEADDAAVVELANEYVAAQIPYAWGGGHGPEPGPSQGVSDGGGYADACGDYNKIGLDCSGLARDFTWNLYGVDINGTAATQYASGMPVAPEDARPGDIFFPTSAGRPPGHVTVYIGNNSMLEAQQSGTLVMISPLSDGEFRRYVQ